ncbi:hypothetical protein Hanom_Chr03g00232021 [Helianthus anomalus]
MHKEWATFEAFKKKAAEDEAQAAILRAKLEVDRAKFESDQKTEERSVAGWKRKVEAEAALLSKECKNWREICEKDNNEWEQIKAELESVKKDPQLERVERAETSRHLNETEEKLESSETAQVTAESQLEPLKNDMLWLKDRGIISVANSVLNADELDETVAHLLVAARNDEYAQGSATHGVDTEAALVAVKTQFNTLQLPVMDLFTVALQSEDFVTRLREVFPHRDDDDDDDDDDDNLA